MKNLELIIPSNKNTRLEIRKITESYFTLTKILPPISYEDLVDYSQKIIENFQLDSKYKSFVMVCSANAIWRQFVGNVPFNRRILLLPECLKNSKSCEATHDGMGLLCNNCRRCSISEILDQAENLGYVTIVTEGTTIAAQLIESGKIDAVIGIGCLESLQKIFATVYKYSVPSLAVPLLCNGCIDTVADMEWIQQELHVFNSNPDFKLLNLPFTRTKIDSVFTHENILNYLNGKNNKTIDLVATNLLAGGQRLRPVMALLSYEAFANQIDETIENCLALSVECFHKASLIHDDIEDNDSQRYGKKTMHTEHGIAIAINAGDLLQGEGYRLLTQCSLSPEILVDCFAIISQGHRELALGQGAELLFIRNGKIPTLQETLEIFENKTAASFKTATLIGARAGGASKEILDILNHFCIQLGIAYQIKDDLNDYNGHGNDIDIRHFSIFISQLMEILSMDEIQVLQNALIQKNRSEIDEFINKYQIINRIESILQTYLSNAQHVLKKLENVGLKIVLHEILGKVFKSYL